MAKLSPARRIIKRLHPEGIPWPFCCAYARVSNSSAFQRQYRWLAEDIVRVCPSGRLLDVGTGPGWLLRHLAEVGPDLQLTGLDVSAGMIAAARRNLADLGRRVELIEGNAEALPCGDGEFDVVVSSGSVHHWKDQAAGLREVHRVLAAGGTALIYDVVSDTPPAVRRAMHQQVGRLATGLFWLHGFTEPFCTRAAYEELGRAAPFAQVETRFVGILCALVLSGRRG